MQISLRGSKALVTGASRGIGRSIAITLARAGAQVGVHYGASEDAAKETLKQITEAGGEGFLIWADLNQPKEAHRLANETLSKFGQLQILVNNAGIYEECPLEAPNAVDRYEKMLRINLEAPYILARELAPAMEGGCIINITSRAGQRGESRAAPYAISKGGMNMLTVSLARELADRQIRVNAIAPGWVETAMLRNTLQDPERQKAAAGESVLGRVALTQDIADVTLFLASPLASYVTGQIVHVNGGSFLKTS